MRRRIMVLAVAALISVAGCDAAFGSTGRTHCRHGDHGPSQSQPSGQSGFQDG